MILSMIWLYFCCYFLLFGAELNRVIYEDPEDNVIVNTLGAVKDASVKKQQEIKAELDEHSLWRPIGSAEADLPIQQPPDIEIAWADAEQEKKAIAPPTPVRHFEDDSWTNGAVPKTTEEEGPHRNEAEDKVVNLVGGSNEWN